LSKLAGRRAESQTGRTEDAIEVRKTVV
jgi:hypothetical protein